MVPTAPRNIAVAGPLFRLLPRLNPPHWRKALDSIGERDTEPRRPSACSSSRGPKAVRGLPLYVRCELLAAAARSASLANTVFVHCIAMMHAVKAAVVVK